MKLIEIVVPCYNEEACICSLYKAVNTALSQLDDYRWSILFVNDGSSDRTLEELKTLKSNHTDTVNYVSFARNFGKESAIYAGLSNSTGDLVVLMDADLQHPPVLIPQMVKQIEEGHDCCGARRVDRHGEPPIRSFFSKIFYKVINKVTDMKLVQGGSDFRIMTRQMVNAMLELQERERFTKGIMSWVGFDTVWIEYENVERIAGESKWSFCSLAKYALDGFIAFATAPLRFVIYLGVGVVIFSIVYLIITFFSALNSNAPRTGYTTIIILILLMGGVIISLLGVIGEYLARMYNELKHRPIYIEKENTKKEG